MSTRYVALAALMWAVTYPSRALPLLAARVERLPDGVRTYLRLVGPAVLAALATGSLVTTGSGGRTLDVGLTAACTVLCAAVVAWRRNLLVGLVVAVALAAAARAFGWG